MAYLVRKISITRWPDGVNNVFKSVDEISADAITKDLSTENNELSWWKIDDLSEMKMIGYSIISKFSRRQANVKLVAISYEDAAKVLSIKHTPENGDTAIPKIKEKHYDVYGINYNKLGLLGQMIAQATSLKESKFVLNVSLKNAIEELIQMKKNGEVDSSLLGEYIKEQIEL